MLDVGAMATAKATAGPTPPRSRFRPPHRPISPAYAPASVGSFLARLPPPGAAPRGSSLARAPPRRARHCRCPRAYRSGGRRDGRSGLSPSTARRRRETLEPAERTSNRSPGEDCFPLLGKLVRSLSGTTRRDGSKTTEFEGIYHLKSRVLRGFTSISEDIQASKRCRGSFEGRRGTEGFKEFRGKSIAPPGVVVPALFSSVLRKSGFVKAKEHTLTNPLLRKKTFRGRGVVGEDRGGTAGRPRRSPVGRRPQLAEFRAPLQRSAWRRRTARHILQERGYTLLKA